MPDIVDPDVDDNYIRLMLQDVTVQPSFKIRHSVAADAGADDLNSGLWPFCVNGLAKQRQITTRTGTLAGDGISKEHDAITVIQLAVCSRHYGEGRHAEQNPDGSHL